LRAESLHEVVDTVGFLAQPLAAIIVVEEQRLWIGLPGEAEGVGDVLVAKLLPEHRVSEPRSIIGNRLVDDVPGDDASAIMLRDRPDMVFKCRAQIVCG